MNAYWQCLRGIVLREWLRFVLQRSRFLSALVRPLLWLLVFAAGFRAALGIAIIALVALLPKGLVGINDKWQKKVAAQTDKSPAAIEQGADRG